MTRPSPKSGTSSLAATALERLAQDKPVRLELPGGGVLAIQRRLPVICVYRLPTDAADFAAKQLLDSEDSYVIVPADAKHASQTIQLLRRVAKHLSEDYGTLLLIEIWEEGELLPEPEVDTESVQPPYELVAPSARIPRATVEALARALGRDARSPVATEIKLGTHDKLAPPGSKPLVQLRDLKEWNAYLVGVAVHPVYRQPETREVDHAALEMVAHQLHFALEQAYFAFTRQRMSLGIAHYHAPGRRSVVKSVFDIDRQLVEIARSFDLLLQATPVNAESAWREFSRGRFSKAPLFYYRPLPVDPVLLKRQLYAIPVERIEDPTLAYLFRQKQEELDRQITLLTDIDSPRFLPESLQIYGGVSDWLLQHAHELLERIAARRGDEYSRGEVSATEFAKLAQQELGYYQQKCADFTASVAVRDEMYPGMMVSGDQLLIGSNMRIPRRRVEALLQHEIGTHLVTRYNGHRQPFQQLEVGLAGYDGLQEGLAVLAEYLVGGLSPTRMRILAARVVAARKMLDGASFIDTFRMLDRTFEFAQRTAYTVTMRVYRGGGLTKDAVYLRGLLQILRYLREGGELEPLFVGKMASTHLPLIAELGHREIIKPPALRPRYLENSDAQAKLERLRDGMKLLDLLNQDGTT